MKLDRIIIKAKDYRQSFEFYHDILGLKLKNSWQRKDSWGALFYCGDMLLEIIWFPDGEGNAECRYIPDHSKTELYLNVNNVDALHNQLSSRTNLKLAKPEDKPWGHRIFAVYDPDNVKIVFSQPI